MGISIGRSTEAWRHKLSLEHTVSWTLELKYKNNRFAFLSLSILCVSFFCFIVLIKMVAFKWKYWIRLSKWFNHYQQHKCLFDINCDFYLVQWTFDTMHKHTYPITLQFGNSSHAKLFHIGYVVAMIQSRNLLSLASSISYQKTLFDAKTFLFFLFCCSRDCWWFFFGYLFMEFGLPPLYLRTYATCVLILYRTMETKFSYEGYSLIRTYEI